MATASVAFAFTASPSVPGARALGTSRRVRVSRRSVTRRGLGTSGDVAPNDPPNVSVGTAIRRRGLVHPARVVRSRAPPRRAAPRHLLHAHRRRRRGSLRPHHRARPSPSRIHRRRRLRQVPHRAPALGAAFNLNGGAAVLEKLGLLSTFRRLNNPMRVVRTRRATPDRTQLMRVDVPDLIDPTRRRARVARRRGRRARVRDGDARGSPPRARGRPPRGHVTTRTRSHGRARARRTRRWRVVGLRGRVDVGSIRPRRRRRRDQIGGARVGVRRRAREIFRDPNRLRVHRRGDESASVSARDPAEHGEVHQWFGDGCYTLVYTAGGGETRRDAAKTRQHNIAVCVSDEPSTDENAEWTRAGGNDAAKTDADAKAACLRAIDAYDMPEDVRRVAERCDRFFDVGVHYHDPLPRWRDAAALSSSRETAVTPCRRSSARARTRACRTHGV